VAVSGEYTLQEEDFIASSKLHGRRQGSLAHIVSMLVSLAAVCWYGWLLLTCPSAATAEFFTAALAGSIYIILTPLSPLILAALARREYRQSRSMWIAQPTQCDEEGVSFESARGQVRFTWSDFHRWAKDDSSVLLYQTNHCFLTLPLRGFPPGAGEQVASWLRAAGLKQR
jgi:hypothetical protein